MKIRFTDYSLGAGVATDLVNTAGEVRSAGDFLDGPGALAAFLVEHGLRPEALEHTCSPSRRDLNEVHSLRRRVRSILEATQDDAVEGASGLVAGAGRGPRLLRDDDRAWQWYLMTEPHTRLADELGVLIGIGLLGVIHNLGHSRFRPCESPVCNGVFVDSSKAGRRRYCMPEICGNRLNVAKYRARQRALGNSLAAPPDIPVRFRPLFATLPGTSKPGTTTTG
ncbi:MAG: CGNR zinc finger domain-containing protein [Stackebrandtia sp.]